MERKTPLFGIKIEEILKNATTGIKNCEQSGEPFAIRQEDINFYRNMQIPLPTTAPSVRSQILMSHLSPDELFKRKSAFSGKEIITNIDPECPVPVYSNDEWWSDSWNPLSFGFPYNRDRGFFEQFYELKKRVPRPTKIQSPTNENSDWVIGGYHLKNCYLVVGGTECELAFYSVSPIKSREIMETFFVSDCELCYDLFECKRCYHSAFLEECEDCINCYFGFDLKNCEYCFGCANLYHKKYYFFNQQLTKEQYEEKIKAINLSSRKNTDYWRAKFELLRGNFFRSNLRLKNVENSLGDDLTECKNCYHCVRVSKSQDSAYVFNGINIRFSYDIIAGARLEHCISCAAKDSYNLKFCGDLMYDSSNSEYCELCMDVENCFGCIGLMHKKFCILNHQYTEDEYWRTLDIIKCDMLEKGEYGQVVPMRYSIYPYNLTYAYHFYPLSAEQANKLGVRFYDYGPVTQVVGGLKASDLPDDIRDVSPEIIGKPLICAETGRIFSVIKQEFEMYKKMNLPLPTTYPRARRLKQYAKWRVPLIKKGRCGQCGKDIFIRGDLESQRAKVVCHECYLKLVC